MRRSIIFQRRKSRNNSNELQVILLALALAASACGGGAEPGSSDPSGGSDTTLAASGEGTTTAPPDSSGDDAVELPVGTVTIGSETYEFSQEPIAASLNCRPNANGTFTALLRLVNENGELISRSDLDLTLIHEDAEGDEEETSFVRVRLGHLDDGSLDYTPGWSADAASAERFGYPAGASQVDSYTIDGTTVTGTATFIDGESDAAFARGEVDTVESVQGTFTVTCIG